MGKRAAQWRTAIAPAALAAAVAVLIPLLATLTTATASAAAPAQPALVPVDQLPVPQGVAGDQCKPYKSQAEAKTALENVQANLLASLINRPVAKELFTQYLTPGLMSASRRAVTDAAAIKEFQDAPATQAAYSKVQAVVTNKVIAGVNNGNLTIPASGSISALGVGQKITVNWTPANGSPVTSTPGLIAGSGGDRTASNPSLISQLGNFLDTRDINASYAIQFVRDSDGTLRQVLLKLTSVSLHVEDSIDFCPGALGGATGSTLTLPMSRLERTVHAAGDGPPPLKGGWTQPVLWQADVPLADASMDITEQFQNQSKPKTIEGTLIVDSSKQPYNTSGQVRFSANRIGDCTMPNVKCEYSLTQATGTVNYKDPQNDHCAGIGSAPPWFGQTLPGTTLELSSFGNDPTTKYVVFSLDGQVQLNGLQCDHGTIQFATGEIGGVAKAGSSWVPGLTTMEIQLDDQVGASQGRLDLDFKY